MPVLDGDAVDPTKYSLMGPVANGLRVRKNSLGSMVMGVDDTQGDGVYWMVLSTQYKTTGQSLQIGLAPNQSPLAPVLDTTASLRTVGYLHCDSGFTVGVYVAIHATKIALGTFTRSGTTFTYTPTVTWDATQAISTSARVEVKNAPASTAFSVLLDDVVVIDNVTVAATLNAVTRNNAAVSIMRATLDTEPKQDSPWASVIAVSDYIPQAYIGSGAKISRTTATAVSGPATGASVLPLPTGYFTTTVRTTSDITCTPSTGRFTVSVEGWYEVKFNVVLAATPTAALYCALLKNGSVYEYGAQAPAAVVLNSSWTIYLTPGDYVQAGYRYLAAATTANLFGGGDVASAFAYFTITLANRSIG